MPNQFQSPEISTLPRSDTAPQRKVFVRGLKLDAFIGAYDYEKDEKQPIIIDLVADVIEPSHPTGDRLEDVVCYDKLTQGIRAIIDEGHIKLVETLAERVADLALSHSMVLGVSVRITKPNAITEAQAVGVEIFRAKQ